MILPSFADVQDAAVRLDGLAIRTPLLRADALDAACGGRVFVKAEALQRTGAFKFRGAYNRVSRLTAQERTAGVVAFSSGNHAQGVACAAQMVGCPAVIVMPSDAPASKIAATRGYGAEVVTYDRFTESREGIAAALTEQRGAVLVPPFDDLHVIAGQGTAGLEAASQLEALGLTADVLVCPVSGGGLLAGITLAFSELSPATRLYCAEPAAFDDYARSLAAGERLTFASGAASLCDALMSPFPGVLTFAINQPRLAGGLTVTDDEALAAMAFAFRHLKLVLEPGGAVALASLLTGKLDLDDGVALVIASGGNVDPSVYARALAA
ncbi:MAG: threonine ammonia-lyase [Caulobacteraceae bacterium]